MFPLCSAPGRGKPPASSTAIIADRPRGYHELVIDGRALDADVPAGVALSSAPFTVGGIRWRVMCYPNEHPLLLESEGYSPPYTPPRLQTEPALWYELVLDEDVAKPVRARFKFSVEVEQQQKQRKRSLFFLNSKPKPKVPFEFTSSEGVASFFWKGDEHGGSNFRRTELGELLRRHGADRFTIRCEVVVINGFRTEAPPPPLVSIPPSDLHENFSAYADKLCRRVVRVVDAGAAASMLALAEKHHCDVLKKACKDVLNNAPPAKQRGLSSWAFAPTDGHKASN